MHGGTGMKTRVIDLISAVRTLRSTFLQCANYSNASSYDPVPLIVLNTLVILYELALG